MTYHVLISKQAEKEIEKVPRSISIKVKEAILSLARNPRPNGCKKLQGRDGYRIRIGNFRIVYDIDDKIVTVYILTVMDRKDVYKK